MYDIGDLTVEEFLKKIAEPSFPGPASGSVAAATGAMAAALIEMSCLATLKKIKDEKLEIIVEKAEKLRAYSLALANDDMDAVGRLIKSLKKDPEIFEQLMQEATEPLIQIAKAGESILKLLEGAIPLCIPQVLGDLAGSLCYADAAIYAAQKGAEMNLDLIKDEDYKKRVRNIIKNISSNSSVIRERIMDMI